MDMFFTDAWDWIQANPITVGIVVWLITNIMPRVPQPKEGTFAFAIWETVERLMVLSGDRFLGSWKPLFAPPQDSKWTS